MARPMVDFVLPGILLAALSLVFFIFPIDLVVEGWFYSAERGGWFLKDAEPLVMIYNKGLLPALCVSLGSVVVLLAGFKWGHLRKYRRVATYLLLVMVIAPGLIVNALMKEGWGRPRPRQVEEFGGQEVYERLWEYDGQSFGKSFPSGHAAMGFYFFAVYFLLRREGRKSAWLWLGGALFFGGLLGFTRMAQGGHFPSDVLWSAGVCYLVAAGLYYAMGLHRGLWYAGGKLSRGSVLACLVALLGISVLGVGTPYYEEKNFVVEPAKLQTVAEVDLKLELPYANLRVATGSELSIRAEAEGFGSPGSRLEDRFDADVVDDGRVFRLRLRQEKSGFFATVEQPMSVTLPRGVAVDGEVVLERGVMRLDLWQADIAGLGVGASWELDLGEVEFTLLVPEGMDVKLELADGVDFKVKNEIEGLEWDGEKRRWKRGDSPVVKVRVKRFGGGVFVIKEALAPGE